jgi:hypothetical protein
MVALRGVRSALGIAPKFSQTSVPKNPPRKFDRFKETGYTVNRREPMTDAKQLIIESKTHGTFTVLYDADDHDKVSAHTWSAQRDFNTTTDKFYISTNIPHPGGGWYYRLDGNRRRLTTLSIHRLIMDAPKGMDIDHINGNPLDNRKSNLRICTRAENQSNRGPQKNNTSGYKGVSYKKPSKSWKAQKWRAQINCRGESICIGYFDTPEEAARAYDTKAKELHGEYAYLNFPDK